MSEINTRLLRSNCRKHGTGSCSCHLELPVTPRRSRSVSKTPSRASSIAPELTFHPSENISPVSENGCLISSYVRGNNTSSEKLYHAGSQYEDSQQIRRNYINDEISSRSRYEEDNISSRSLRFDEDDRLSQHSQVKNRFNGRSSERGSSQGSVRDYNGRTGRMVQTYSIEEESFEETGNDKNSYDSSATMRLDDHNGSMAFSLNSSFGSTIGHETSRVSTSSTKVTMNTTTTKTAMKTMSNGYHVADESQRLITILRSPSVESSGVYGGYNNNIVSRIKQSCSNYQITSGTSSVLTYIQNALLYVPKLIYWSLVNLFVCEKWLLHQSVSTSSSYSTLLKRLLLLGLLFFLSGFLYSCSGTIASFFDRSTKMPVIASYNSDDSYPAPPGMLAVPPKCCEVPTSNIEVDKLLKRMAELEKSQQHYQRLAEENYSKNLKSVAENLELKLQQEITKIEPGKVVVQKETIIQKVNDPTPPPEVPTANVEIDKLLERIAMLEKSQQHYQRLAEENYHKHLKSIVENMELKLQQDIQKIEPGKVIVEKETIVQRVTEPAQPLDMDEISSSLMPLLLPLIMDKVRGDVKSETQCPEKIDPESSTAAASGYFAGMDLSDIEKMIRAAIAKYDADKTGLPDLALEPAGGSILSTRCTKSSQSKNSVLTFWGWRVWSFSNSPRSIIQPGVVPGECWVVEGATAEVVIQLISPAIITGFTLEHIPKSISPYGKIDTAPRKFQVMGLMSENDMDTIWDYGTFEYLDNNEPIQYFAVQNKSDIAYPIVELRVLSNHGSVKSTCIYRFRVHGGRIDFKH